MGVQKEESDSWKRRGAYCRGVYLEQMCAFSVICLPALQKSHLNTETSPTLEF